MKEVIITLIAILLASTTFACVDDKDDLYEEIIRTNGFTYFIVVGSDKKTNDIFTITTKRINTKKMKTAKKNNQCTKEDMVIDCKNSSFQIKNSKSYYNGNLVGYTRRGEEHENAEEALFTKLEQFYCGDKKPALGTLKPACTKLVSKDAYSRSFERLQLESEDKEICK